MGILDTLANLPPEQSQGLLAAGLGILANNTGHYGAFGQALGAGGLTGLQNYQGQMGLKRKYGLEERGLNIQDAYKKMQEQQMQYNLDLMNQARQHFLTPQPTQQAAQPTQAQPVGTGTVLAPQDQAQPLSQPTQSIDLGQADREGTARYAQFLAAAKGDPGALLTANAQLYPPGVAVREGGMANSQTGKQILPPMLTPVAGLAQRLNPQTGQYEYYKPVGSDLVSQQAGSLESAKAEAAAQVADPRTMVEVPVGTYGKKLVPRSSLMAPTKGGQGAANSTAGNSAFGMLPGVEQDTMSKNLATAREGYSSASMAAQEALPSLQLMKGALINGLKTGNLAEYTSGFGNWMQSFGVDPTQYGINDPTNVQEFSKGATKLVADMTRALGGREPFQAMQFVQKGNPGLGNTVDANVKLVALAEGTKQWEIARDREAQKWADAHGGTTDGFIQNFQMKNPVNRYWQQSYDALQKQMPQNPIIARPLSPTGGQNLNITTEPNSLPLKKRSDGSYDYVPR